MLDGGEQRRALGSLAQALYGQGRFDEAATTLASLLELAPPPREYGRALLLLGAIQRQQGRTDLARQSLETYIEGGAPAVANARILLAGALAAGGDDGAAIEELQLALAEDLPAAREAEALRTLAGAQESAGLGQEALTSRERLAEIAATPVERGEALWQVATLAGRIGEGQRAQEALATLARDYPGHPRALESLALSPYAPEPVLTAMERGIVLFNQGSDEQAVETFQVSLDEDASASGQARAHIFLAFLSERAKDNEAALTQYEAALAALAGMEGDRLFGEAAWERALLLEALGRTEEAVADYVSIADLSPASVRASESLFRAGFLRFREGRPADAVSLWTRYLEIAPAAETARARFWLAKAAIAVGDGASADVHLAEAARAAPWGYYGLRAQALLDGLPPLSLDEPSPQTEPPDWTAAEAWLAVWAGPEDAAARQGLTAGVPWLRGLELLAAGLQDEADEQFDALLSDATGRPWLLYRLARELAGQGQTAIAARAAARLIGDRADAPPAILRVAYPAEYLDLAAAEAADNGFPPLLLLALVRQESFFQPDAESSAGALGLTQVIPSTADEIADQLDEAGFTYSDLLRPNVSLRFGAHYLGAQLKLFQGDITAALAAYNGGPGNSLRWSEAAPDDPDLFLESIDLSETHAYVEAVTEHYARYRYAYGLAEGPELPLS